MTHLPYIVAAYLASAIALLALIAGVLLDLSAQGRKLRRLEAEGLRRRSELPR